MTHTLLTSYVQPVARMWLSQRFSEAQ